MSRRENELKRQIIIESALLVAASILLGFAYTYFTKQGFFAEKKKSTPTLEIVSIAEAKKYFDSRSAMFIDSRHEFEYKVGHIRGAINISLTDFEMHRTRLEGIQRDRLILIYCDGADCNSSLELSLKLIELGYNNVKIFYGGWEEWKNNNLPVEK
jgi:rhodanese-related sulfurtransferase